MNLEQVTLKQQMAPQYEAPQVTPYGDLLTLTQGSGGDEPDGCSSGYYDSGPDDE
jgi:hypothetical protein